MEEEGMHSYVEGLDYGSWESEIMAMGGDPAFMDSLNEERTSVDTKEMDPMSPSISFMESLSIFNQESTTTDDDDDSESWAPLKGMGPRPKHRPTITSHEILVGNTVEWDGTVDEDAYFDD